MLSQASVTRYVTPLREGGSLPGLVEADDLGTYVCKFRAAGQGPGVLVAEVVTAELGRLLGVRVPDLVALDLDVEIGRREPDPEVQELLVASAGLNLGVDFLPGATGYDGTGWTPPPEDAERVRWLDAFVGNVDRSWRNPNLLVWHRRLWAIDHGATLVFQYAWPDVDTWATKAYDLAGHVLAPVADTLPAPDRDALDADLRGRLDDAAIDAAIAKVPVDWLGGPDEAAERARLATYLRARLAAADSWQTVAA